jgi:beta-lactam-binding protein with PASTA domain
VAVFVENVVQVPRVKGNLLILAGGNAPVSQNCDIFSGLDTYGWPPPETGLPWNYAQKFNPLVIAQGPVTSPIPSVLGLTLAAATALLTADGFTAVNAGSVYSSTYPIGTVATQTPAAGSAGAPATAVLLILSLGIAPQPFPTIQATIEALSAAGFVASPVFVYEYSSTVPDGYVISISPQPGSDVPVNTPVQLTVSLGPATPALTTLIPNVVGMLFLDAQKALSAASLEVGNITWRQGAGEINVVVAQSPIESVTPVPLWTQINLEFLSGPAITYPGQGDIIVPPLPP